MEVEVASMCPGTPYRTEALLQAGDGTECQLAAFLKAS